MPGADQSGFPLSSLPYGVGGPRGASPGVLVAIGDHALDLAGCAASGLFGEYGAYHPVWQAEDLIPFLDAGRGFHRAVRARLRDLLADGSAERALVEPHLVARDTLEMRAPVRPPDFVDYYASYHHAVRSMNAAGRGAPVDVDPNWRSMPVGYHSRSGTVIGPDAHIRRPNGQYETSAGPVAGASRSLDFELEVGIILARGSALGERVTADAFAEHAFGLTLLNDWSARDLQRWESRPLGPFTAKSFATQIGPWVLPLEALAGAAGRNETQVTATDYLRHDQSWTFDVDLEARIQSAAMRRRGIAPMRITATNLRHMHWDPAQLLAHLTVNGASTRPGDLLGTGTASGPDDSSAACLLELTRAGRPLLELPDGTTRGWLEDGDEITLAGFANTGSGLRPLSFGDLTGRIVPATPFP